jgi:hypothetical protein
MSVFDFVKQSKSTRLTRKSLSAKVQIDLKELHSPHFNQKHLNSRGLNKLNLEMCASAAQRGLALSPLSAL